MQWTIYFYITVFLYGIVIGSFLNVCIYRIPAGESLMGRSHCMGCGRTLRWYDLVPIFSYLFLRGRCRGCGERISVQYPLIEAANGILYVVVFMANGVSADSVLYCLLASALLSLSVIDERSYEIPWVFNLFIALVGVGMCVLDFPNVVPHLIGAVCVSAVLFVIYLISRGEAIGGGDVKLMAAAGLVLGWQRIVLALFIGCILGSVIHVTRMRVSKKDHVLALGPYLSAGILIAALWGEQMINWYLSGLM